MPPRTTTSYVTFAHPFVMAVHTDELLPGTCQVIAEEEILQSLNFVAYETLGEQCTLIELPENAHLDRSGNNWECYKNFQKSKKAISSKQLTLHNSGL